MTPKQKRNLVAAAGIAAVSALVVSDREPQHAATAEPPRYSTVGALLRWEHSTSDSVTGYNVYITSNRVNPDWSRYATLSYTNALGVTNLFPPVWFAVSALDADGFESDLSNIAGVLGVDRVVTVWSEVTTNLAGDEWRYLAPVQTITNPPEAQAFYRLGITQTNQLRVEP